MAQFQLVMHSGPTPGKTFPLEGDVLTIGREASNPIAINDAEVSRKHTQFVFQGGKYIVTDLGSTNGTFVNGTRLTGQQVLQPGDIISLGEQINLLYEAVQVIDPNATIISSSSARVMPAPAAPAPVVRPAAQPVYAGQIPASPQPAYTPVPSAKKGGLPIPAILAGVVLLCAVCACAAFLWYVDSSGAWCNFFPFLFGSSCG
ncbi:MAG: hypothetical protein CO094_04170 [Anaerolineae bacterium CG_4_9_14_3_um_filter_57_17]|nr:FHA domain-containing protein [bacterium]NCT21414.1 FHA domain-containing protein [bacterium]OIO83171.1 MAG: hypothetical protein AUK01_13405 [Anaerolineae bacterium CG2_30_57_67]PJB67393.1 MAG: hypothetical protein CO094_04170 [Anaerolineae bacterium CG_4_9_14_3_um_filter_57_17]